MTNINNAKEIKWIDSVKAVGIISVVIGHIYYAPYCYIYHMPLFFLIGGLLYKPQNLRTFFIKKFKHLIIPYISFLIILSIPDIIHILKIHESTNLGSYLVNTIYGGGEITRK